MAAKNHVRSISLPSRSHPSTIAIEQELNKLRTMEASSSSSCLLSSVSLCSGLTGLEVLYGCTDELLKKSSVQKVLSQNQGSKFVDEFLDGSIRLIDVCCAGKDFLTETNEHVRKIQSAIRRRKTESAMEGVVADYTSFRKKTNKEVKKLNCSLRQTEIKIRVSNSTNQDHQLTALIYVLREVNAISVSILKSLMSFFSSPAMKIHRGGNWAIVSKLLMKEGERKQENEIEIVDSAIQQCRDFLELQKKLEDLENRVEEIESCLEGVFRGLIRTRAALLNVIFSKNRECL